MIHNYTVKNVLYREQNRVESVLKLDLPRLLEGLLASTLFRPLGEKVSDFATVCIELK